MVLTRHRSLDTVERVNSSQASHTMAKPCKHEVPSLQQEWDELANDKKELELKLTAYNKSAFLKAQQSIRRGSGNTMDKWVDTRARMENERRALIEEKNAVEARMNAIKPMLKEQVRQQAESGDTRLGLFMAMLEELRAIRQLLESKNE